MKTVIASTMIAIATLTAVPAKAADDRAVFGAILGAVIGYELTRDRSPAPVEPVYRQERTERNDNRDYGHRNGRRVGHDDHRKVCHVEYRRATHGRDVRYEYDCRGRLINTTR
jgi:hypothetical protein